MPVYWFYVCIVLLVPSPRAMGGTRSQTNTDFLNAEVAKVAQKSQKKPLKDSLFLRLLRLLRALCVQRLFDGLTSRAPR